VNNLIKIYAFVSLLLISCIGYSQNNGFIGISSGLSFPQNGFSETLMENYGAGFAKPGIDFSWVSAGYYLNDYLGIMAMFSSCSNPLDEEMFSEEFNQIIHWYGVEVNANPWRYNSLMGGMLISFPFETGVKLEARGLLGTSEASSPEINIDFTFIDKQGLHTVEMVQKSANSSSIANLIGAGIKIPAGRLLYFSINVDYYYSEHEFRYVFEDKFLNEHFKGEWDVNIETITTKLEISFRLF